MLGLPELNYILLVQNSHMARPQSLEGQETPVEVCMYRNGRNCWQPNSQVVCMLADLGKELYCIIPTSCSVNPANKPF